MATYKRMRYGTQVVEWTDAEMIARRYDVADITAALADAVCTRLVETKPITAAWAARFDQMWIGHGCVTRVQA
jgi:hypothetical protein